MQEGAVGLSTALQYAPAPYAKTGELIALAGEAAKFGGIYSTTCATKAIQCSTLSMKLYALARSWQESSVKG